MTNELPDDMKEALRELSTSEGTAPPEKEPEQETPASVESSAGVDDDATANDPPQGEQSSEEPEQPQGDPPADSWWNDTEVAFGLSHRISEDDVKKFSSQADYRHALELLAQTQRRQPEQQFQQPAPSVNPPTAPVDQLQEQESAFERVKLDPDEYGQPIIDFVDKMQDRLEQQDQRLRQQENVHLQNEHQRRVQMFESTVEKLNLPDLFGTQENMTHLNAQIRHQLWDAAQQWELQSAGIGQHVNFDESLVRRIAEMSYPEQFERQRQSASNKQKILKQSKQRMGGGQSTAEPPRAWDGDESSNPELLDAYKKMVAENGTGY